ncbi:MAG TPA: RelA/SpoT domain-containing protein [Mucilaginibacter sp.]|nr:RelA/SpoT domain-containing protein [Mucilaginibacter sp.]
MKELLETYSEQKEKYLKLAERLETVISQILDKAKIHAISSRVKTIESLIGKILEKDNKYKELTEITDLCGIRIITNLESDIEYVNKIIKENFKIDELNSLDHRKKPVNEFGYLSLHLVVSLDKDREDLAENAEIKGLKAEIQIRSILQHAWAEIEHDLGYKNKEVPKELQRGTNRLAAILEAADLELVRLSSLKSIHIKEAFKAIASSVGNNTQIDSLNIQVLDSQNETLKAVRKMLQNEHGVTFIKKGNYENILEKLKFFGIEYLEQLEKGLNGNKNVLIKFSDLLFQRRNDNRKYILYEAPLEYYLHFLGSDQGIEKWNDYRYFGSVDCKSTIKEVTDFLSLHKDSIALQKK